MDRWRVYPSGKRQYREAFSIARSYKAVGQVLSDTMMFYDQCATEAALVTAHDRSAYLGNPQLVIKRLLMRLHCWKKI